MAVIVQAACRNRLLALMSPQDFALLAPSLEAVKLPRGFVMVEKDGVVEHVYLPDVGIASIVSTSPEGQSVEAGLFGWDGAGPLAPLMGSNSSVHRVLFQVAGEGHRIASQALVDAMDRSSSLRLLIHRFALTLNTQTSFTALSNAVHQIDERLARWLLMCHDRHAGDKIALTHEFLSLMLAVRRPSVTTALHVLEGNRFIRNERGYVTIRNRQALEEFARDSYGIPEAEYRRLIGIMSAPKG